MSKSAHFFRNRICLSIKDPLIRERYISQSRRRVHLLSIFWIVVRLTTILYRISSYQTISSCEDSPYYLLSGIGIQIIILLISLKWQWVIALVSPVVLLSYVNKIFCEDGLMNDSILIAVILDVVVSDIFSSLLLSVSWILTVIASSGLKIMVFYIATNNERDYATFSLIIYPLSLCMII